METDNSSLEQDHQNEQVQLSTDIAEIPDSEAGSNSVGAMKPIAELIRTRYELINERIEDWPSIPRLALMTLKPLHDRGLDRNGPEEFAVRDRIQKMQAQLGDDAGPPVERPRTAFNYFVSNPDAQERLGVYPVPSEITGGEKLVLTLGDHNAENWYKRVPNISTGAGEVEDIPITMAMIMYWGGYLDRKDFADEKDMESSDPDSLRKVLRIDAILKKARQILTGLAKDNPSPSDCRELLNGLAHRRTDESAKFILELVRYRREVFDELPWETQLDILESVSERLAGVFDAVRRLEAALDYGMSGKNLTPKLREPEMDVDAAILSDVYGLSQTQIASRWGNKLSESDKIKGSSSTVAKAIKRGREILQKTLGQETWERLKREIPGASNDPLN